MYQLLCQPGTAVMFSFCTYWVTYCTEWSFEFVSTYGDFVPLPKQIFAACCPVGEDLVFLSLKVLRIVWFFHHFSVLIQYGKEFLLGLCTHSGICFCSPLIILTWIKEEVLVWLPKDLSAVVVLQFSAVWDPLPSHIDAWLCLVLW